jgi:hypothetical protein
MVADLKRIDFFFGLTWGELSLVMTDLSFLDFLHG